MFSISSRSSLLSVLMELVRLRRKECQWEEGAGVVNNLLTSGLFPRNRAAYWTESTVLKKDQCLRQHRGTKDETHLLRCWLHASWFTSNNKQNHCQGQQQETKSTIVKQQETRLFVEDRCLL